MKRALGTCYYPEHWPEKIWAEDARRMAEAGLTWVRIGEFAWSRLEPSPGAYDFDWLARAIQTLRAAGLKVMLGTPSATPPRWMLDRFPDMLAVDREGRPRKFGSRRHYCHSHAGYRDASAAMAARLAQRFGHDIDAWQIDNEYGCHDTTISYSDAARAGFQDWLAETYGDVERLNLAWGNVFWSMEYNSFNQIDLPNLTVTEPNPSHALAFRRYASHAVARWHRAQVAAIRPHSDAPISHNFMGRVTDFDHFDLSEDLEIATWDSYPMGFLEDRVPADTPHKQLFMRQGDPDFQAFHHDLYRAVGRGRWWVAEQQPGPVNWAPSNPAPMPGMVRLWTWEAFAHGAEAVCYFRWRQAPFAQEQHHAGLLRPDSVDAPGLIEARQVARELAKYPDVETAQSPVALIFDYTSQWAAEIQPQGEGYDYFALVFHIYRTLRRLGQSVDILPPTAQALGGYSAVFVPGLLTIPETLRTALATCEGQVVTGPRTDLKTPELTTKVPLGPDLPGLDVTVTRVETFRPDVTLPLAGGGAVQFWLEDCETSADVLMRFGQQPVFMRSGARWHIAGWPDAVAARRMVTQVLDAAGLPVLDLPEGVRVRQAGAGRIWFNYANEQKDFGEISLPPAGVHWDAP